MDSIHEDSCGIGRCGGVAENYQETGDWYQRFGWRHNRSGETLQITNMCFYDLTNSGISNTASSDVLLRLKYSVCGLGNNEGSNNWDGIYAFGNDNDAGKCYLLSDIEL